MADHSDAKAVLVITDGLGYSRPRQDAILREVWEALDGGLRERLLAAARGDAELARWALCPVAAEVLPEDTPIEEAAALLNQLRKIRQEAGPLMEEARPAIIAAAQHARYVPWASDGWSSMAEFRNAHLTLPTHAAGKWVGFEDIAPPVQGNSETGHIQIGSMAMAPQVSRQITNAIEDRSFFSNSALVGCLEHAKKQGRNLNMVFMISGTCGTDGLVHSNWRHLDAFAQLAFAIHKLPPQRVRMLAILDGRDGPAHGSVERGDDGIGNYLEMLRKLLAKYDAVESLAWIAGRGTAMDRDYQEHNMEAMWRLLTQGQGEAAASLEEAADCVRQQHAAGTADAAVAPIAIRDGQGQLRTIAEGDAVVNLNFRSDRQRALTATLLAAKEFLAKESQARGRPWEMGWLNRNLGLRYCAISSYSPELDELPNAAVAFPKTPVKETLLELCGEHKPQLSYTLVAESVKSSHVGYFLRGCREQPLHSQLERRLIVPSFDAASGIKSDSDVHLQPQMRTDEIERLMLEQLDQPERRLLICNFAATDMVGHLLPQRYQAAREAYASTVRSVLRIAKEARARGWHFVWTSDHGNVEEDSPSHTANNVLTTIAAPRGTLEPSPRMDGFQARLFDIAPTLALLLDLDWTGGAGDPFQGVPLIRRRG